MKTLPKYAGMKLGKPNIHLFLGTKASFRNARTGDLIGCWEYWKRGRLPKLQRIILGGVWTEQTHANPWGLVGCTHNCGVRAGRCHYETTLHSLLEGVTSGRDYWGLEKRKCHSCLQKGQNGRPRALEGSQPHLSPWKPDGKHNPGSNFCVYEGQEADLEYWAWLLEVVSSPFVKGNHVWPAW